MVTDFIHELETLTNQQITPKTTEIGFLLPVNATLTIHFIELNKLTKDLDLPTWKAKNNLEHVVSIFENEWAEKRGVVLSRIKSKLGLCNKVFARKTSIVKLNRSEAFDFLNQNHTNIPLKTKSNFGLMYNNELIAIACFGPTMHKKTEGKGDQSGELIRFCNKLDYTVVGGLSKLLKHYINQYQVDDIMTYIDKDWSDGKSFIQLGFEIVGEKHQFPHYVDITKHEFALQDNKSITIYKSGLMKLLLKVKK
ncbi:MAG: hypothetical protein A3K10_02655 [Bacteroidetes bacterium RIFCSPLOWO2_12_FULL_31_6]|nr:MAG: hypothetical protein A3K10_02655 [Bacteroidetes bacterium RIFCSPLOWO2_12_FULL_31_6]